MIVHYASCFLLIHCALKKYQHCAWLCVSVRWICGLGIGCHAGKSSEVQHILAFSSVSPNVLHLESTIPTLKAFRFIRRCMHNERINQPNSLMHVLFQSSLDTEIVVDVQLTRKSLPQRAMPTFTISLRVSLRYFTACSPNFID